MEDDHESHNLIIIFTMGYKMSEKWSARKHEAIVELVNHGRVV